MPIGRVMILAVALVVPWAPLSAQAPERVRGTLETVAGDHLGVRTREGAMVEVRLKQDSDIFVVTPTRQAQYLTQAYGIAKRHPSIDMLLWFLLRDEAAVGRWQSGLITFKGTRKPAFARRSMDGVGMTPPKVLLTP